MKIVKYTPIRTTNDIKGHTINCYVTFEDGRKKRLRKRVKKDKIPLEKQYWESRLNIGSNPLSGEERASRLASGEITFNEAWQQYKESFIGSPDTLKAYMYKLRHIGYQYGDDALASMTAKLLEDIIKEKIKNGVYSQSTVNQARKTFNVFFNWAVKSEHILRSPMREVGKLKSEKDVEERLNPIEERDFIEIMNHIKSLENKNLYFFVNFIYHACLRPKELREMKIGDLDLKNKRIRVRASVAKNNKLQYVPIYPALEKIIKDMDLSSANNDDFAFSMHARTWSKNVYGSSKHRKDFFADWFRDELKKLGLYEGKGISIYSIKHTSNIHKIDGYKLGKPWKTSQLQKLNRHSSIDQTLTYLAKIRKITDIDDLESMEL